MTSDAAHCRTRLDSAGNFSVFFNLSSIKMIHDLMMWIKKQEDNSYMRHTEHNFYSAIQ